MIFNLLEYFFNLYPTENIFANAQGKVFPDESVPDRRVLLTETGGGVEANGNFMNPSLQVRCRDIDAVKARKLAYQIYGNLHNHFAITLPAVTVGGDVFPAILINQISANAIPQCLETDNNGRVEWVANYRLYYEGG